MDWYLENGRSERAEIMHNRASRSLRRWTVGVATALVSSATLFASPPAAVAETRPPCGGHVIGNDYYYTNCNYNAVRIEVDVFMGGDYKLCLYGKEYRDYIGRASRINGTKVDKVYQGPNYYHTCPFDR
jgi:hypothetical protein